MENKTEIRTDYIDIMKAINTKKVFVFCKKCNELKRASSIDSIINERCDECTDKLMDGVKIPTFN